MKKLFFGVMFGIIAVLSSTGLLTTETVYVNRTNSDENKTVNESYDDTYECDDFGVLNDILDGYNGPGYNLEEEYYSSIIKPLSLDNKNKCNEYCVSHGPGRENGGTNLLSIGCRNYLGWSYGNYGAIDIPYWINMTSINTITNVAHRNALVADLRAQAEMWNQSSMHDGTGQIVNLYEVGIGSTTRPANINGRRVVEVLRQDGGYSGQFSPSELQVRINYGASGGGLQGRNIDTPVHEFGHLLGLYDLEPDGSGIARGTHKTLMAYNRGTTAANINSAIKYQDIQGIAVLNNRHICSNAHFKRYVKSGNNYLHICIYCDRIDSRTSIIPGSLPMEDATTCEHDYQPMVSHGDRHWHKCTKCYKVIETPFKVKGLTATTLEVTGAVGTLTGSVTIPSTIGGQTVTSIGPSAFVNRTGLTGVTIPASVTSIGDQAFIRCTSLVHVNIPASITTIGEYVFAGCDSLTSITIPGSIASISYSAFAGCDNLAYVTIQNGVGTIGNSAFSGCISLINLTIPQSVTAIGNFAFNGCVSLEDFTIPQNVVQVGTNPFGSCVRLVLTWEYNPDMPTVSLANFKQYIKKAIIPDGVEYIETNAFENSINLISVTWGPSLIEIRTGAFFGCINFTGFNDIGDVIISPYTMQQTSGGYLPLNNIEINAGDGFLIKVPDLFGVKVLSNDNENIKIVNVLEYENEALINYAGAYNFGASDMLFPFGRQDAYYILLKNDSNVNYTGITFSVTEPENGYEYPSEYTDFELFLNNINMVGNTAFISLTGSSQNNNRVVTIPSNIEVIYISGVSGHIYTNVRFIIASNIIFNFCNFSFTAHAAENAITCDGDLTLNITGSCKIYGGNGIDSNYNNRNQQAGKIGIEANNLTITGTGELEVVGGNGGSGLGTYENWYDERGFRLTTPRITGTPGGIGGKGISCQVLNAIDINGFKITGGNGGSGASGVRIYGGNGGSGGHGISCPSSFRNVSGNAIINGGTGGAGGKVYDEMGYLLLSGHGRDGSEGRPWQ